MTKSNAQYEMLILKTPHLTSVCCTLLLPSCSSSSSASSSSSSSLSLDDAKLYPSSANVSVFLGCLLDDQLWHYVLVKRSNKQVNLTVDGHTRHLSTTGVEDSLEVDYEVRHHSLMYCISLEPLQIMRYN